jgi:hypothetical protein
MNDVNGKPIVIGCKVKHTQQHHHQAFVGIAEVLETHGHCAKVRQSGPQHIPYHIPELLEVVG